MPKRWAKVIPRKDPIYAGYDVRFYEGPFRVGGAIVPESDEFPTDEETYAEAWRIAEEWQDKNSLAESSENPALSE